MGLSIRASMYRAVSLLIIVPVLLLSLVLSYFYSIRLEAVIVDSLHAVAAAQIAEMDGLCERQKSILQSIGDMELTRVALRGELKGENLKYLEDLLSARVEMTDYLKNIAVITADSRVVACTAEGYSPIAKDGFSVISKSVSDNTFWITDILTVQGEDGDTRAVAGILRIDDGDEVLGYVLSEIDLSFYDEIRKRAELWNESTFYLLDGNKEIIIAGSPNENRESFVTTTEERLDYGKKYYAIDFEANPKGNFQYEVKGKKYITYYSDTKYTNWRMLLSVNMDIYLQQRTHYAITACVIVLFCAALSLWIGQFSSLRIVKPIRHITDTLADIENIQDYSVRVEKERADELGALSVGINRLLELIENENIYQAQQQRRLQEKADHDALTKVLNKGKIMQQLHEVVDRCRVDQGIMAVLFVDIDNFKDFNTNFGHGVGDQVLLFIASLLEHETGGIVGRVGGDEFLVIMESPEHLQELESILGRINITAESQFIIRGTGKQVPVSVCIGAVRVDFSEANTTELTPEQLSTWADGAMYRVKNSGKRGYLVCSTDDCLGKAAIWDE